MLGFVELGSVKSLKVFQVLCQNSYRSFENAEKSLREKEKQLTRGPALAHEKCIKTTTTQMSKLQEPVRKICLRNCASRNRGFSRDNWVTT